MSDAWIRRPTPLMTAGLVVLGLLLCRSWQPASIEGGRRYRVHVKRVYDGDTFETVTGQRVRLLGIDAPEVAHGSQVAEPWSAESTEWLRSLVHQREVVVEEGVVATDRYGRTLAWVYLPDGRLLSELALQRGHARLLTRFGLPLLLEDRLARAQQEARQQGAGLWSNTRAKALH